MIMQSRLAMFSAVVASVGFVGCDAQFNPAGTWNVSYDRFESFSTYSGHPEQRSEIDIESYVGGPVPPLATGVAVTYNAATNTADFGGTPLVLDANHSALISETEMPMIAPGCTVTEYQRATFDFDDTNGHTAVYRQEQGFRFVGMNCSTLLQTLETAILGGGAIPSELQDMVYTGGLSIVLLDEVTTTGIAIVAVGERVSAAEGSNSQEFAFTVSGQALANLRALRERSVGALSLADALAAAARGI